jgi:hypothetical protein
MSDDEPTYRFIKDEGWVSSYESDEGRFICYFTDALGVTWRVHERRPNAGERWTALTPSDKDIWQVLGWYSLTGTSPTSDVWSGDDYEYDTYFVFLPA